MEPVKALHFVIFFVQAEDGIRDKLVTGVQTCALPIWYQILQQVESDMSPYQSRGIFVNVDFYAGSVYALLEIPNDLFVPIFAIGRIPGWCTEVLEQYDNNMLIRPLLQYTGPMKMEYTPIEQR